MADNENIDSTSTGAPRQHWYDEENCVLDGMKFVVGRSNYAKLKTQSDLVYVLKGRTFFEAYAKRFRDCPPRTLLEVGIFEGGSAMLFADLWRNARIIGIDQRPPSDEVRKHLERFGFSDRVSLFYGVSQEDGKKIREIFDAVLSGPVDLVIDDGSHLLEPTRRAFEIIFPHLKNGRQYIIEDWGWAHWPLWQDTEQWKDEPAMSNLIFELVMACATSPEIIATVEANRSYCVITKAVKCPPLGPDFSLTKLYVARGKVLSKI